MRKLGLLVVTTLSLGFSCGWAGAASARTDQGRWERRALTVWRAYRHDQKREQQKAEAAVLSEGRRKAAVELGKLLPKSRPSDARRLPVAFTMGLLNLNYPAARDALVWYLQAASAPPLPGYPHMKSWVVDAGDSSEYQDLPPEDVTVVVYQVYQRHHDSRLVHALVEAMRFEDGALGEALSYVLGQFCRDRPRALVKELSIQKREMTAKVAKLIAALELGPNRSPRKAYPGLAKLAATKGDPLAPTAKRLLADMEKGKGRKGS